MKSCRAFTRLMLLLGLAVLLLPTLAGARGRGFRNDGHDEDAFSARGRQRRGNVIVVGEVRGSRVPRVVVVPQSFRGSGRPPGWDRGRKVGWSDCDVSPGLAKKFGYRESAFDRERRLPRRGPAIVIPVP